MQSGVTLFEGSDSRIGCQLLIIPVTIFKISVAKPCDHGTVIGTELKGWERFNKPVIFSEYGADTLRLYEMFMGPIESSKPWDPNGVEASRKFIERIYRLYTTENKIKDEKNIDGNTLPFPFSTSIFQFHRI